MANLFLTKTGTSLILSAVMIGKIFFSTYLPFMSVSPKISISLASLSRISSGDTPSLKASVSSLLSQ
jgi:hypothetical protein